MSASPTHRTSTSQTSLSPAASQTQSLRPDIPLETLVSHLLASKRSLSSISTVWRANEIVTSARAALEESVILSAKTEFLRRGIEAQRKVLRKVRGGIEGVYGEGQRDFKSVIHTLDTANTRLESTLSTLRTTHIHPSFRPATETPRSLLDFVDESGVELMRNALKDSIRECKESQTSFDTSILAFDDDLRALKSALRNSVQIDGGESKSPIPELLGELDYHAQEMASLLDALVQHFDLCVTAIRHTEGGYAAVRKAASSQPPGAEPVSVSGVMDGADAARDEEAPISEEERREMLDVLETDAAQVEDVVVELRERLADMEAKDELIREYVSALSTSYAQTVSTYTLLETLASRLPLYIAASQDFSAHWQEMKIQIGEQLEELESMRTFYEGYHAAYDGLIMEVYRRRDVEERMREVWRRAWAQVERIRREEVREREVFRGEVGEYLPVDLWGGVGRGVGRWGVVRVEEEGLAEGQGSQRQMELELELDTPVLDRDVVEAAIKRRQEREREER